ncbi:hypothetical protein L195_g033545 [Trifolium pratense]|uniref:Uncharacterized protein n=1 Tax=Trifolium pratense TaxID=57577 RepID=A0A2K3LGB9_TRIPR|nr:hypothetical protein L195_g033545 [Trifolium pratense]
MLLYLSPGVVIRVIVFDVALFKPWCSGEVVYIAPALGKTLDGVNGHQVAAGKRLESHDSGGRGLLLIGPCSS